MTIIFSETHPGYPSWAVIAKGFHGVLLQRGYFRIIVIEKLFKCSINLSFRGIQFS